MPTTGVKEKPNTVEPPYLALVALLGRALTARRGDFRR
jgi:hypothetical protein